MALLTYTAIASLDGYVTDEDGDFSWAQPDEQVHRYANEQEEAVGTHLLGRRMYEVMAGWHRDGWLAGAPPFVRDFADAWRAADTIVYSTTLATVTTARTRVERSFDPDAVRRLVARADRNVSIGGPGLAAAALHAGLVDECSLLVVPVVVGGGTRWLPDRLRLDLELAGSRRFSSGIVLLRYRTRR